MFKILHIGDSHIYADLMTGMVQTTSSKTFLAWVVQNSFTGLNCQIFRIPPEQVILRHYLLIP